MSSILELHGVSYAFGDIQALRDVSVSVRSGETLALIGHNGAGKTTLFRLVLGFLSPDLGSISVSGATPGTRNAQRAVAYLPESVAFPKNLTGEEVVCFYGRLRGASRRKSFDALERVGLSEAATRRCGSYSKGMRQRLGLAQALVGAPGLLILDEPTSGLDPISRHAFYTLLDEIAAYGTAVVLSSHGLNELESHTQRVAMLSEGRLIASGSVKKLLADADLPMRVRVRGGRISTEKLARAMAGDMREDGSCEIECRVADKLAVVKKLLDLDEAPADLELYTPGLNELYRHFAGANHRAVVDAIL